MFTVIVFKDKNGKEPIKDYIFSLVQKGAANKTARIHFEKIMGHIKILEQLGTRAGMPYMRFIGNDLWELRPLNNRIFFFHFHNGIFVLLHYFIKKTQKTPQREIKQAERNMIEVLQRSVKK